MRSPHRLSSYSSDLETSGHTESRLATRSTNCGDKSPKSDHLTRETKCTETLITLPPLLIRVSVYSQRVSLGLQRTGDSDVSATFIAIQMGGAWMIVESVFVRCVPDLGASSPGLRQAVRYLRQARDAIARLPSKPCLGATAASEDAK